MVFQVLNELDPEHALEHDPLREELRDAFPWYDHETVHIELCEPEAWWSHVTGGIDKALVASGIAPEKAAEAARAARTRLMEPSTWDVYPDARPALQRTKDAGWRNAVLSNHGPELEDVVAGVGLGELIDNVVTSARVGYEKPHPGIYQGALEALKPERAWMVGDNPIADVAGAERAGIPAILVRAERVDDAYERMIDRFWGADFMPGWREQVTRIAPDLHGATDIILSGDQRSLLAGRAVE